MNNVRQRRNNVYMNNVRQRRNNVTIFNVEFHNVGKCRRNVVKMTISRKKSQIEYTEFKVLTTTS